MKNLVNQSSQLADDPVNFVDREVSLSSVRDDDSLEIATFALWIAECKKRGGTLGECIEGAFKLLLKGTWSKRTRNATCTGQLAGGERVGVRVRPSND